ncbi:MAG: molybdopterin molybdenumtransferase MoeA [Nitrospirae bacterium]|nr:MAG: molybdopterin molybdenumtransferase MoeA [Nitrospirota bacterium]
MKGIFKDRDVITVEKAISLLMEAQLKTVEDELTSIDNAYGLVLSEDVYSPEDLPGFSRSTMDGYAVNAEDTYGASEASPAYLTITARVQMGKEADFSLSRGEAAEIPTGGMLPEGANAVVMFEHTNRVDETMIEVLRPVAIGENIIRADEDIKRGELVLTRGHRLRPQDIGALAGLGITRIRTYRKPLVSILCTGDEIVPPQEPIAPGRVRDINSYNLYGLIVEAGGIPKKMGIIRDEPERLKEVLLKACSESDMVLVTGGSSVGERDFTARLISELGKPGILFHGVSIKPGKPLIGAVANGKPIFGLPGHPAAVTVCFENFVRPVLKKIGGESLKEKVKDCTVKALFTRNLSSNPGRQEHVRVKLYHQQGRLMAEPVLGKSGLIKTLVESDGVVIIPKGSNGLYEGQEVEVRLFHQ